jgi:hypothetical protein
MAATARLYPAAALVRLQAMRDLFWLTQPLEAVERLRRMMGSTTIIRLYQHYFPEDYRHSKKSLQCKSACGHSPREIEFFELVGRRLFPVADLAYDYDDERIDYIPVDTCALDPEAMDAWKTPWLIIFGLVQHDFADVDWDAVMETLPEEAELPGFVTDRTECRLDEKRFFRRAARLDPHLKDIRLVFCMAAFSTGNVFLDTTYEMLGCSEMPDWNRENMDWLIKEWRRGQVLLDRIDAAIEWLEDDPQRLANLIHLYNQCLIRKERQLPPAPLR